MNVVERGGNESPMRSFASLASLLVAASLAVGCSDDGDRGRPAGVDGTAGKGSEAAGGNGVGGASGVAGAAGASPGNGGSAGAGAGAIGPGGAGGASGAGAGPITPGGAGGASGAGAGPIGPGGAGGAAGAGAGPIGPGGAAGTGSGPGGAGGAGGAGAAPVGGGAGAGSSPTAGTGGAAGGAGGPGSCVGQVDDTEPNDTLLTAYDLGTLSPDFSDECGGTTPQRSFDGSVGPGDVDFAKIYGAENNVKCGHSPEIFAFEPTKVNACLVAKCDEGQVEYQCKGGAGADLGNGYYGCCGNLSNGTAVELANFTCLGGKKNSAKLLVKISSLPGATTCEPYGVLVLF